MIYRAQVVIRDFADCLKVFITKKIENEKMFVMCQKGINVYSDSQFNKGIVKISV